jgi:Domain of Unknown Function (DUF928)
MIWITISRCFPFILSVLALELAMPANGLAERLPAPAPLLPQREKGTGGEGKRHQPSDKQSGSDLPLPPRNPDSSSAGGRRDGTVCPQDTAAATTTPVLTALSPTSEPGLTLAERPTFLVYVPQTSAQTAEFSLRTSGDLGVYRTIVTLNHTAGIVAIRLPADAPPLAIGDLYIWSFNLICNPSDRLDDLFVTGSVQRIEENAALGRSLEQATPADLVRLYQQSGLWYDALSILFARYQTQPNDPNLIQSWTDLLQLGKIGATPSI